jgi:hypothetical protein
MEEQWSRVLFSRVAVCERGVARTMGRQAGSSGWGWYQRTERAKFRRVVVDAKGEFGLLMRMIREVGNRWERRNTCRYLETTTPSPCTSSSWLAIWLFAHAQAQMRRLFGKWFDVLLHLLDRRTLPTFVALKNPEPLQVLLDATLKTATPPAIACLNIPTSLNPPTTTVPLGKPCVCAQSYRSWFCYRLGLASRQSCNIVIQKTYTWMSILQPCCMQALRVLIRHR